MSWRLLGVFVAAVVVVQRVRLGCISGMPRCRYFGQAGMTASPPLFQIALSPGRTNGGRDRFLVRPPSTGPATLPPQVPRRAE